MRKFLINFPHHLSGDQMSPPGLDAEGDMKSSHRCVLDYLDRSRDSCGIIFKLKDDRSYMDGWWWRKDWVVELNKRD